MNIQSFISYDLAPWQWGALVFASLCIGMSKTGINGISTAAIPLYALIFGAKPSTGVILPLLCLADLFAVIYYRRHAEWKYIIRLLPWALAGFSLALLTDRFVPARSFKILVGLCIITGLVVMFWNDRRGKERAPPSSWWFSALFGILGGFATMIGNAAGPIMSVFLLSMRLPKAGFIGTAAWFFLIVNYLKLPLQYFAWHNISRSSLLLDLAIAPCILVGAWLGVILVKKLSEAHYRVMVYVLSAVTALLLFL